MPATDDRPQPPIAVDRSALTDLHTHATTALRVLGTVDAADGQVATQLNKVSCRLKELLDRAPVADYALAMQAQREVAHAFNGLTYAVARVDAILSATRLLLERFAADDGFEDGWNEEDGRSRQLEQLDALLGTAKESLRTARRAGDRMSGALAKHGVIP